MIDTRALLATVALVALAGTSACGSTTTSPPQTSASDVMTSSAPAPTPSPTPTPASTPASTPPTPSGPTFTEVVNADLDLLAGLIGEPSTSPAIATVLLSFDGDVPRPSGNVVGAGTWVETFPSPRIVEALGLDMTLSPSDIENFSATLPGGWTLNSVATSGTLTTLLATHTDRRRLVIVVDQDPPPGEAPTQVQVETAVDPVTPSPWLATLPSLAGGEIDRFALGIGGVAVNYVAAGDGLAAATWRYSDDQTEAILGALDGGGFAASGFTVVDPDAIRVGATSRDVTSNDWVGEVVVGADTFDGETTTSVTWLLRRE